MTSTSLEGQVERITYHNAENGYTIARLKVAGEKNLVTVVGNIPGLSVGQILELEGAWVSHPVHGDQFKIARYRSVAPSTDYGVRKYLGSGLIKGIGPEMARRLVETFGAETMDIIEKEPEKLLRVSGIGAKRVEMIKHAWAAHREIRELQIFLQGHDIGPSFALKIFRIYGERSLEMVTRQPYRLALDISGIGFASADKIAERLGSPKDSPQRAEAGVLFMLRQQMNEGHVYYPYRQLLVQCRKELSIEEDFAAKGLASCASEQKIVLEDLNTGEDIIPDNKAVYLGGYYHGEVEISSMLKQIRSYPIKSKPIDTEKALHWVEGQLDLVMSDEQKEAVRFALTEKVLVITGGPGTGKTTIIKAMITVFERAGISTLLAAPTGRAAKRMQEATGGDAKTIHRLLEYSFSAGGFKKDRKDPLEGDVLIIDEASMIDTLLFYHLLKAVPLTTTLILIGDINQLPSVGPGNVLRDIIDSHVFPVVFLSRIFRQKQESLIVTNAHRVNTGHMPYLKKSSEGRYEDFYFIRQEDTEGILKCILELVEERIPSRFGFDPFREIQVLTPMNRGIIGTQNLNRMLQDALNPQARLIQPGFRTFRLHDKVMQIRNNYEKEVFNGDIGTITAVHDEMQELEVTFMEKTVPYDYIELDDLTLAYAVTIHKSQGSEYMSVIIPLHTQHSLMLQRNLLYTGITRGKRLVVLVGSPRALRLAVQNNRIIHRFTRLKERLSGL